jgi:hypothetical protein
MSGLRFSPRWALSPRDWDVHPSWLKKSNTCPTRPEGKLKGKKQRQQQHKEEQQQHQEQDQMISSGDGCSRYTPEGQVQGGNPTQSFQTSGQVGPSCQEPLA